MTAHGTTSTGKNRKSHVFGPVPSRRLGRSLGIDIVPFKTCTYDCIYCQLGHTTVKTAERQPFVAVDAVLRDVADAMAAMPAVDYLTLSGSGEPTLHSDIGRIVETLKREYDTPVAVLTNGSLLGDPRVRESLMAADIVLPTLAAEDETTFSCVHRPHESLHFYDVVRGLVDFSAQFTNRLWLELFLLDGITAIDTSVMSMKAVIDKMLPEKVQINTATRPPAESFACPVAQAQLVRFARMIGPRSEVIAEYGGSAARHHRRTDAVFRRSVLGILAAASGQQRQPHTPHRQVEIPHAGQRHPA